jgi:hypothetical protein
MSERTNRSGHHTSPAIAGVFLAVMGEGTGPAQLGDDAGDNFFDRLVFPDMEHSPSCTDEPLVVVAVSRDVGLKLGSPPRPIRAWVASVFRATMPPAPVHKDRESMTGKYHVRGAAQLWNGSNMLSVSESTSVKG